MANYHISQENTGWWRIQREGGKNASAILNSQQEAEIRAKHLASITGGGIVRLHGIDDKIWFTDSVKRRRKSRSSQT